MDASFPVGILRVAKELNIGLGTIAELLNSNGFKIEARPNTKLTEEQYLFLKKKYNEENFLKSEAKLIVTGKVYRNTIIDHVAQLLEKSLKTKGKRLDIGKCGLLIEDFYTDGKLDKLLKKCSHLEELILSNEWWVWDVKLKNWKREESENSNLKNKFYRIPVAISKLVNLKKLVCCGDKEHWRISDLRVLKPLNSLCYLDLSFNAIKDISVLAFLPDLEDVLLCKNQIIKLNGISEIQNVHLLDLRQNEISAINSLKNLKSLKVLDLSYNKIEFINQLNSLENLLFIKLNGNLIRDVNEFSVLSRTKNIYIESTENPYEVTNQMKLLKNENHVYFLLETLQRINNYSEKSTVLYPKKILMLGNHASGKSSLVGYLTKKEFDESTHILKIGHYKIEESKYASVMPDAIFYDFGGQDFYHGIYQAFISENSFQLILFNEDNNENKYGTDVNSLSITNFNLRYWLGQKRYQEIDSIEKSAFIVLQTYSNIETNDFLSINLREYDGFLKSFNINLSKDEVYIKDKNFYDAERLYFKTFFDTYLVGNQVELQEPNWYVEFLEYIFKKEAKDEKPTKVKDLLKYYKNESLSEEENLQSLIVNLITLHRHGIVLFYSSILGLKDVVWLNPESLVKHIQENVLNKDYLTEKTPGVLTKESFEKQLNNKYLLRLLYAQNIVFLHTPTENSIDDEYIIPNYLPIATSDNLELQLFTFGMNDADFTLKFNDFIPFGLINQMICFYGMQPDIKKFWRNKLLFTLEHEIRVLIELDFETLKISVKFHQIQKNKFDEQLLIEYLFFSMLAMYWNNNRNEIFSFKEFLGSKGDLELNEAESFKKQKLDILKTDSRFVSSDIFISLDNERFINYLDLYTKKESNISISSYAIFENRVNLLNPKEVPLIQFKPFSDKKFYKMKKIFISYSKFDEDYLQDFEDHLVSLKNENVATFTCREIEFGKEWDNEIKKQIDECDIMVCLISVKFLNTDYITKIEIPKAIEQNKMIIPIIIKSCDWENSTIGRYQAAQRGKIVSLDNNLKLTDSIKSSNREERDAFWTSIIKEFRKKIFN